MKRLIVTAVFAILASCKTPSYPSTDSSVSDIVVVDEPVQQDAGCQTLDSAVVHVERECAR